MEESSCSVVQGLVSLVVSSAEVAGTFADSSSAGLVVGTNGLSPAASSG